MSNEVIDRKRFGIWLGHYNKTTNQNWSVKGAIKNNNMTSLFKQVEQCYHNNAPKLVPPQSSQSTKRASLNATDLDKVNTEVMKVIKLNSHRKLSRNDLVKLTTFRLSTICGSVKRLIDSRLLFVTGEKFDTETNRTVETVGTIL